MTSQTPAPIGDSRDARPIVSGPMPWGLAAFLGVIFGSIVAGVGGFAAVFAVTGLLDITDGISGGSCATTHRCGESLGGAAILLSIAGWLGGTVGSVIVVPLVAYRRRSLMSALVSGLVVGIVAAMIVLWLFQLFLYSGPEPRVGGFGA